MIAAGSRNARLEGASWVIVSILLQSQVTMCETSSLGESKDHFPYMPIHTRGHRILPL